jgi:hypothetical protein
MGLCCEMEMDEWLVCSPSAVGSADSILMAGAPGAPFILRFSETSF